MKNNFLEVEDGRPDEIQVWFSWKLSHPYKIFSLFGQGIVILVANFILVPKQVQI